MQLLKVVFVWLSLVWSFWSHAAVPQIDRQSPADIALQNLLSESHQDDLDGMVKRGIIRVLVTFSKTHYYVDKGQQYGLAYESIVAFEKQLRQRFQYKGKPPVVLIIPVSRDELLPRLQAGLADIAIANLAITPERQTQVDFSIPVYQNISEVVVASTEAPTVVTLKELSGKSVVVRPSSSYFESLQALNLQLLKSHRLPVNIVLAEEHLETEDLLDMVNAGLIDFTVADSHIVDLWRQVYPGLQLHPDLTLASGREIAWAVRKGTPKLMTEVNRFLQHHREGTLFGNVLRNRYLKSPGRAKEALALSQRKNLKNLDPIFRKYGAEYQIDPLLLMAQGFQESGLNHTLRSPFGAVGIMQIMPATGRSLGVGNIWDLNTNIRGAAKYMRQLIDQYFNSEEIGETDRLLFAIAAYNAGPNRIEQLRKRTEINGLDPNVWYGNVERTVARYAGMETVNYVANISKYYIAYRLLAEQETMRETFRGTDKS